MLLIHLHALIIALKIYILITKLQLKLLVPHLPNYVCLGVSQNGDVKKEPAHLEVSFFFILS